MHFRLFDKSVTECCSSVIIFRSNGGYRGYRKPIRNRSGIFRPQNQSALWIPVPDRALLKPGLPHAGTGTRQGIIRHRYGSNYLPICARDAAPESSARPVLAFWHFVIEAGVRPAWSPCPSVHLENESSGAAPSVSERKGSRVQALSWGGPF